VLAETVWVLQRLYRAGPEEIIETIGDLLGAGQIVIESRAAVIQALMLASKNGGAFADSLIAASAVVAGCSSVVSFDRGAVRAGMTLLK
jgi:predicted nucleic-acid-binding protein